MKINERKDAIISYDFDDYLTKQIEYLKEHPDEFLMQFGITDEDEIQEFEDDRDYFIEQYVGDRVGDFDWYYDDFLMNLDTP